MGLYVYIQEDYSAGSKLREWEDVSAFFDGLKKQIDQEVSTRGERWCCALCNLHFPAKNKVGNEFMRNIDVLVVRPGCLYVMEFKHINGAVQGNETGFWEILPSRKQVTDNGHEDNPYHQVSKTRELLSDFLNSLQGVQWNLKSPCAAVGRRRDELKKCIKSFVYLGPNLEDGELDRITWPTSSDYFFDVMRQGEAACKVMVANDESQAKYQAIKIDQGFVQLLVRVLKLKPARRCKEACGKVVSCLEPNEWGKEQVTDTDEHNTTKAKKQAARLPGCEKTKPALKLSLLRMKIIQSFVGFCREEWIDASRVNADFEKFSGMSVKEFLTCELDFLSGTPRGRRMFRWKADGQLMVGVPVSDVAKRIDDLHVVMRQYVNQVPEDIPFEALSKKYQVDVKSLYIAYLEALKAYGGRT